MTLKELINLNEELPKKGSKERAMYDAGSDAGPLMGQYNKKIKFLINEPEVFADEMMEKFPTFSGTMEKEKDAVLETYKEFAKELAGFFKYLKLNKNITYRKGLKIYKWNKIKDISTIDKFVKLLNQLKK